MFFWFFLVKIDVGAWGGGFVVLKGDYIRPGWRDWRNKGEGINELPPSVTENVTNMNKLAIIILFLTLWTPISNAQTIKLDFEPKGQIIKFYFNSLTIYTDTTSLFFVYKENGTLKDYDLRVKNLVKQQFLNNNTDTAFFSGDFIPFNDSIDNKYQKDWYVEWAILHLTMANRLKIYDKHGQLVEKIVTKKIGTKKKGHVALNPTPKKRG